ncbi:MAG: SPFH domain-containing protein [Arenicella sp.]
MSSIGSIILLAGIAWFLFTVVIKFSSNEKLTIIKNKLNNLRVLAFPAIVIGSLLMLFGNSIFYAEPGYIYHVRTVTGAEKVVSSVGYKFYPFGRWNSWKREMTVQAVASRVDLKQYSGDQVNAESESSSTSASLQPIRLMFLDNVDALSDATVRFRIPADEESFLKMAHGYRTPENLLRTALIPAFKETLQATASLMSAEAYYSGGRTEFNNEFENQMSDGIYIVRREEQKVSSMEIANSSANAALGAEQENFGNQSKTEFKVTKQEDSSGKLLRNSQKFANFGIVVVDARVTDMNPNKAFLQRMTLKQKASADRAIAREQRIQEQEQRLLAISKGEREVAERQAAAKVIQIEKTTDAETTKQLAITKANQQKEQAQIDKETSQIKLEQAAIDAERIKTLADAEAHKKKVLIEADNALQPKLEAEVQIQKMWADAYAKRQVPQYVFGDNDTTPKGGDSETATFMKLMTLQAAKNLNYNREVKK